MNSTDDINQDLLSEYHFDYTKAKPNRFAKENLESFATVTLDKDIADFFSEKCEFDNQRLQGLINDLLRKDIEISQRMSF